MKPGASYEVLFKEPITAVGVQFWGDPGDGIAHVYLDGENIWEGDTEGTDANYPDGASFKLPPDQQLTKNCQSLAEN